MNRLYAIESGYTSTGMIADHRLRVRGVGDRAGRGRAARRAARHRGQPPPGVPRRGARAAGRRARALDRARSPAISCAPRGARSWSPGERQPAVVHAIVAAINAALGNVGRTVALHRAGRVRGRRSRATSSRALARALDRGEVTSLIILGGNPAYTAPRRSRARAARSRRSRSLYLGLYANETARACRYVVPALHELEHWGVARAYDGTLTPIQPLIEPLFGGRSIAEVLHRAARRSAGVPARDRSWPAAWRARGAARRGLRGGARARCAWRAAPPAASTSSLAWGSLGPALAGAGTRSLPALELELRPHPLVHDGRYANNPWLLELPEPITKLTWDNAAQLSPRDRRAARRRRPATSSSSRPAARTLELPAIVVPGHADDSITAARWATAATAASRSRAASAAMRSGCGRGAFQVAVDRRRRAVGTATSRSRRATGGWRTGRSRCRGTLAELRAPSACVAELARHRGDPPTLLAKFPAAGEQWAMSIDLTTCTGCSACVMACAAENNTPVVGRAQVLQQPRDALAADRSLRRGPRRRAGRRGPADAVPALRERAVRVRVSGRGDDAQPRRAQRDDLQPLRRHAVLLEQLPVQGPAVQLVRLQAARRAAASSARNPDVTVRDRGVMEKCTYCVQRIRRAEIDARIADRPIGADEVRTACQQACPTQAIAFGSITNRASAVAEQRAGRTATRCSTIKAPGRGRTYLARDPQSEPGARMTCGRRSDVLIGRPDDAALSDQLLSTTWRPWTRGWKLAFAICGALTLMLFALVTLTVLRGIGMWGNNVPIAWGFGIINFVWWIGIGHAGTFISAILLVLEQHWRTSINRFTEGMTLFAVMQAGLFPLLHLGRPWFAYWLFPYPERDGHLAAGAQRAAVGRRRGVDLLPGVADVLVPRAWSPTSQRCAIARRPARAGSSTASSRSAGAARSSSGATTRSPTSCSPGWRRRWCVSVHSIVSLDFASTGAAGLALDDLSAVLRRRRDLLRLRDGDDADHPGAPGVPARTT